MRVTVRELVNTVVFGLCLTGVCLGSSRGVAGPMATPTPNVRTRVPTEFTMKERDEMGHFGTNLPKGFTAPRDDIEAMLFREYGAVFVARGAVVLPTTIVFRDQAELAAFQKRVPVQTATIGGWPMMLQTPAMRALLLAIDEAAGAGLSISPRDTDSAARSYDDAVDLWASRVEPALQHWVARGKIAQSQADRIRSLKPYEQVSEVLRLENHGFYFAKDLSKSIIYSVAPPGTSQHLSMLAFDVAEFDDRRVRSILEGHGWFQTVVSDLPHFTYLGVGEFALKELGLKKVKHAGRKFWVPDI